MIQPSWVTGRSCGDNTPRRRSSRSRLVSWVLCLLSRRHCHSRCLLGRLGWFGWVSAVHCPEWILTVRIGVVRSKLVYLPGWTSDGMISTLWLGRLLTIQSDLASAMPTAGGLYWWTHYFAGEKYKRPLSFLIGYSNTLGLIGGMCSVDCSQPILFSSNSILTPLQIPSPS